GSFWQLAFAAWGELPNPWGLGFDDKEYWHWVDENCPGCSAGTQQQAMRDFLLAEVVTSRPFPRHMAGLLALRLPRALDIAFTPEGRFAGDARAGVATSLAQFFRIWNRSVIGMAWLAALGLVLAMARRDRRAMVLLGLAPTGFLTGFSLLFYVELRKTVPGYGFLFVLVGIAVAAAIELGKRTSARLSTRQATAGGLALALVFVSQGGQAQEQRPVAGGELHSVVVKNDGDVWGWGNDLYGQLGDDTQTSRYAAVPRAQSVGIVHVVTVAAGSSHTLAITREGEAWAWGDNSMGQLGLGNRAPQLRPVVIPELKRIQAISGGYAHSLALDADGTVWAWGSNLYGQLGGMSLESLEPTRVPVPRRVVAIAAGWFFSLAVDETG
ncbi:MAG: hypothetical protein AAB403_02150, partial [Planctomycetota bacterium]